VEKNRWNPIDDQPIVNASEMCYLLRKIVNSDGERIAELRDLIIKHKKVIVFYNFNYELDLIKDMLEFNAFIFSEWNGHKHQEIPKGDHWVYLVQYTAGAEAWNCIETNVIIFYSQNYSYKIMEQSAGRIDRLNTPFQVLYYYHLISNSNIDKSIKLALENKKQFNELAYFNSLS
jgi:superfamily II DNA or RNA helicase